MENMTQHIFRVDEDHAINIQSFDGRPITDTVLDGIFTREKLYGDSSCDDNLKEEGAGNPRKLTFVIQDAIRCNGKDLTQSNIVQRIAYVRVRNLICFSTQTSSRLLYDFRILGGDYETAIVCSEQPEGL